MTEFVALTLPSVFLVAIVALGICLARIFSDLTFRRHQPSADAVLPPEQVARYAPFQHAAHLQRLANSWHREAIVQKVRFEEVGVGLSIVAPALMWLGAVEPILESNRLVSTDGMSLAHLVAVVGVLVTLLCTRRPTSRHVETRLRAEVVRWHLHAYLAGVGQHRSGEDTAASIGEKVNSASTESLLTDLRECEIFCLLQSIGADPNPKLRPTSPMDADTYILERIGEQGSYFDQASRRMQSGYSRSAVVLITVIALAALVAVYNLFATSEDAHENTINWFAILGGVGVLMLGLRAVFGWDSKASLYVRQIEVLRSAADGVRAAAAGMARNLPAADVDFERNAARFEAAMAREAADWGLVSERQYYDVSF